MAHSHGIFQETTKKETVVIAVRYDDGEPASYAQVKISSPKGGNIEYQIGRTDKNGCFAFLPELPGRWRITIDDGLGHKIDTDFVVGDSPGIEKKAPVTVCPRWHGVLTGLSLIFGISGLLMVFRMRKLSRQDR